VADVSATPEALYSLRESVSLAFMVALHDLPPQQRATLILRDVLDWRAAEVAEFLELSIPAVNSALQRARATLAKHYHPIGLEATEAPTITPTSQALLDRYMRAWEAHDVGALMALLKEDATFSMPPRPLWYRGREAIGQFFQTAVFTTEGAGDWRLVPMSANAQPAYVLYRRNQPAGTFAYFGLMLVTVSGDSIASSVAFIDPALGTRYGFPLELPSAPETH
jgi:RNA polymerase sigma-70 factor (ECF subfamily)